MSTFLIRSATSQSSSYPIVLTRLGGPRSRPNPHLKHNITIIFYYHTYYLSFCRQNSSFIDLFAVCLHSAVSGSILDRVGIFNFSLRMVLGGMAEKNSVASSVPNIPGSNPKNFLNDFIVKACVLLIAIRSSFGDVNLVAPLVLFDKIG